MRSIGGFFGGGPRPSLNAFGTPHGSKLVSGTPKTASCTAASRICRSADLSFDGFTETTQRSSDGGRIWPTSLPSVERGPNSTKQRAPSACIARTCLIHCTDDVMCFVSIATESAPPAVYAGAPVTFENILAPDAGLIDAAAACTLAPNALPAGAISGVWKAPLTLSGTTRKPLACSFADSAPTAASVPEMTTWPGSLRLASQTSPPATDRSLAPGPMTAAIAWPFAIFAASAIAVARWHTRLNAVSRSRAPAAWRAAISPSEWPAA